MVLKAFLTIHHGHDEVGTLHLDLYDDVVPRTVENFTSFLKGRSGAVAYKNSISHRLVKGFMAQFGDTTRGDGTGGTSIYGDKFDDENFIKRHDRPGTLSMANSGPHSNGSQFFVTFRATPHLDGKHVVFGHVDLARSADVLKRLEQVPTNRSSNGPIKPVIIADCGVLPEKEKQYSNLTEKTLPIGAAEKPAAAIEESVDEEDMDDEQPEDGGNVSKSQAIRTRLRKLKMKMNQARQLNRKALLREGEEMGSEEGKVKHKNRRRQEENRLEKLAWEAKNTKALEIASEAGVDAKYLVEPAEESMKSAMKRAEKDKERKFHIKDYHNPEGQFRNYDRNLKSIPRQQYAEASTASNSDTFDPMMNAADPEKQREGARRLADELHRRHEKQATKRNRLEFEETDVSHINKRNKMFNKKISRNYDESAAEIRQNLERGTAL